MFTSKFLLPMLQKAVICLLLLFVSIQKQCVYNPENFSVTADNPMNPFTNCLEYCIQYYSNKPQRAYYNTTSQNCEPVRHCNYSNNYYNYDTNNCYTDPAFTILNKSYIPDTTQQAPPATSANPSMQIVCVNGQFNMVQIGAPAICLCDLLWQSSLKYDMNGFPFFCDIVTKNPQRHFYNSLKYDENGIIISYGPFTANQMKILLSNMANLQAKQQQEYALNRSASIMYALNNNVPQQPNIREYQYKYLIIIFILALVVFWISYWEYEKLRIKISKQRLITIIKQIVESHEIIRQIQ